MATKSLKDLKQEYAPKLSSKTADSKSILDLKRQYNAANVAKDIQSRLTKLGKDSQSLLDGYNSRFFDKDGKYITDVYRSSEDAGNWLYDVETRREALETEGSEIKKLLADYGEYFDKDMAANINSILDGNVKVINGIVSDSLMDKEYWDKFEDENAWKEAVQAQKEYADMSTADLGSLKSEIDELEKLQGMYNRTDAESRIHGTPDAKTRWNMVSGERATAGNATPNNPFGNTPSGVKQALDSVGKPKDEVEDQKELLSKLGWDYINPSEYSPETIGEVIAEKRAYYNHAEYIQNGIKMASVADPESDLYDPEFELYAQKGKELGGGKPWEFFGTYLGDNEVEDIRNYFEDGEMSSGRSNRHNMILAMNEEEVSIYNYYLGKYGKEKAESYLSYLESTLNARYANHLHGEIDSKIESLFFASVVGLDQFATGMRDLVNTSDSYIPTSPYQQASAMVGEDMAEAGWGWKAAYDLISTTSNMAPSIITSAALSYVNPVLGQVAGSALIGASASGNAYAEAINLGYTKEQARGYSLLVGGSEAGLQYLLGGIGSLGGAATKGLTAKTATKLASNFDRAFAKIAVTSGVKLVGGMVSEFGEEYLQEILNPVFKNIALGTNEDFKLYTPEALYAGFLGALSAGLLEGGSTISGEISTYKAGKDVIAAKQTDSLAKLGLSYSADTVAYKIASQVNENTDAYTLGQLLREVGADHLSAENIADITAELTNRGMALNNAQSIAKWLNKAVEGEYFTERQISALENNEIISEVFRDVIINENSSVNQRVQGLKNINDAVKKGKPTATADIDVDTNEKTASSQSNFVPLSAEQIETVAKVYEAMGMPYEQAKSMAVAQFSDSTIKVTSSEQNATEGKFEVSDDGKTVNTKTGDAVEVVNISGISDSGEVDLTLKDGTVVKASDISFGNPAEAAFVGYISELKLGKNAISAETANDLYQAAMSALRPNPDMTVSEASSLIRGLAEAYTYGAYSFGEERLTETDENGKAKRFAGELTDTQRRFAYEHGKKDRAAKVESEQKAITEAKGKAKPSKKHPGKIVFENGINVNESDLSDFQKANLEGIKLLAEISSIEFHIYQTEKVNGKWQYTMADGTVVGANGWYVAGTNEIWVDLNAGEFGEGAMIRTAAHEISHYIKEKSPKQWQAMADLLMQTFAENDVDVESMLNRQIAKIKRRYKASKDAVPSQSVLREMAYEELVSDALSDMLTDGSIVNFIAEVKAKDQSLRKRILEAIRNLLKKWGLVVDSYKGKDLDTDEAKALSQFEDTFKKLQEMYRDAFIDANEVAEVQKNTAKEGDVKKSDRITSNMSDSERADILRDKIITNVPMVKDLSADIVQKFENISSWEDINNLFGSKKSTLIQKLVSEFGVFKRYSNADINISFEFSKNNFRESYHKQKANYERFAKMFSVFDSVVKNAVGIEAHNRNSDGYKPDVTLKNVYVLMSAFEDGDLIIPVKLEVKEFKDKQNTLYVAISLEGIKKAEVSKQGTTENGVAQNSRSATIIICDLFSKINPKDINFLKYIPNEFLTKEQIAEKETVKENSKKLSDRDSAYMEAVSRGDTEAEERMVYEAARSAGYTERVMHGTRRFGFTKTDVSKSDDKISFFATDSLETAGTYSQRAEIRRISTKDSTEYAQSLDTVEKNISDNIKGLVAYCNNLVGEQVITEQDFAEYIDNIVAELKGDISKQGSYSVLDERIFDLSQEMVERYYQKNPSKAKTLERFEESKEAAGIWNEISVFNDAILKDIDSFNVGGTSGVYELFANTDGHLIVECDGSMWDEIKTKDLPSKLSLNGLKYIAHGGIKYWTTRSVAQYAKDHGYPGVTFKNVVDSGNGVAIKPSTVYIFFDPQAQVKSADPVTYDDKGNVIPLSERFNKNNDDIRYSERDYPVDPDVDNIVKNAYTSTKGTMHELSSITADQNKAINRLVNQSGDNSFQGKYTGGKHRFSDTAVRHIIAEHGDFLREGLRAQLPMTLTDVARHLSAIKDNKNPSSIKASRTKQGNPSILTSYEVNGYTLYAEEITKPLGKNLPSDLIGHTMYKAPTLSTAAFYATSAQTQPKRQSEVLCKYYMPNSTVLSTENFVADKNGDPAILYFVSKNGSAKQDPRTSGLIALSSDSTSFTDKSGQVDQGYVRCKKPFYITQENRVFSNSETNVAQKIEELKKQGYDCFIFDKTVGDNYMIAVVNKAQIIKNKPTRIFSERGSDSVSTRSLLANALEGAVQNDIERKKLGEYKEKIALLDSEQQKLAAIQKQLFTKGAVDPATRKKLQLEAKQISNRINIYDRQLLNLEATTALKNVLEREKARARKKQKEIDNMILQGQKDKAAAKQRELMDRYKESRRKATESRHRTAMRHKIKTVVNDLNNLLLKPSKERHVPEELRIAVAEALSIINMDTVGADERVAKYNALIAKANDPDIIASLTETRDRILAQGNKLSEKLTKLKEAYEMVRDSTDDSLSSIYDEVIYNKIGSVQKKIGKTSLRDMTLEQLESVYELYTAVLTIVRNSNKAFAEDLKLTRQALGSNTFTEIKENNKSRDRIKYESAEKFWWQNLKPMQAMKKIGSATLQKLWNNILYGQEVFARDYDEAVKFAKEMKEKYGYEKWDLNKLYSFESKSGKPMKINLEQMMSIYAYSKRAQADEHIEYGGIVLNEGVIKEKNKLGKVVEVKVNDSTAYRLNRMQVGEIVATLEKEFPGAKEFVDEMQKYLSETMGEKGNEVSMKMYGIKLFKESHYFPLKSSKDFMEAANAKLKGDVKIKNKGMTKSTVEHARNPIVLENFLDVWGNHVNEMGMYHGLVLPLEDFSRTLNYSFQADENLNTDAESVRTALHDAFGDSADNYLNELLKAINGGVLHDSSAGFADRMISKFKKAKVMASLSVIVQQPTAIIRAMGIIEPKYFVAQNFKHKATWEELKKYCPTAIIKETGSFDTNMGRTIVDMIKDDRGFTDKVGDLLGKAPAYMDEMGWNMIWRALKNKVATEQKLSGEALLEECGKQMTLIINETQVYDSVMARNELMRSKSVFTKMATAFMAEPSTVANMIYGAALDAKRGKKGIATKTVAAVVSSVVVNGLVSAMVYALRDDDEDETFLEKYISSATTEVLDGLNPLTYIPFVKDAYSLFQGYKVERTDLALIGDVYDALNTFYNVLDSEVYEGMSGKEIANHIYENSVPLLTSVCDMFGLPVGNVLRDAKSVIVNDSLPLSQTSSSGTKYAFKEGLLSTLPKIVQKIIGEGTKQDKLYEAIIDGDTAYIDRLKSGYKDDEAYETALRKALRENDPRIKEAAKARFNGDFDEYESLFEEIESEGNFEFDTIKSAINTEFNKLDADDDETVEEDVDKVESIYSTSDMNAAFESGDTSSALEIIDDLVRVKTENYIADGETEKDAKAKAQASVKASMTAYWKPLYIAAYHNKDNEEMKRIRIILLSSGLYGRANDVVKTGMSWIKSSKK